MAITAWICTLDKRYGTRMAPTTASTTRSQSLAVIHSLKSYPGLTQGQIYHYHSVNGEGLLSYLIMVQGSTWYFLDAATGNWILTLINVPSGIAVTDQDGSILIYTYNSATGNILCWNSSQAIPPLGPVGTNQQQWKMRFGATIDAVNDTSWIQVGPSGDTTAQELVHSGYSMNITIQAGLPFSGGFGASASGISAVLQDENRVPKQLFGYYKGSGSSIGSPIDPDTFSAWVVNINEHATAYSSYPNLTATQNSNLGYHGYAKMVQDHNGSIAWQQLHLELGRSKL